MQISISTNAEKDEIIDQLIKFNCQNLKMDRDEYITPLNFHIKENGRIIAGVNAFASAKSSVFVSILWVDEKFRGNDFGSLLLQHVENEAIKLGVKLIFLDTFDFQARDFYIKQGFQEFSSLQGHPAFGRTVFFMKKEL